MKQYLFVIFYIILFMYVNAAVGGTSQLIKIPATSFQVSHNDANAEKEEGRIFFNAITSFIMSSDWFPIEFNVPDTISTLAEGTSSMWSGLMDYFAPNENIPRYVLKLAKQLDKML